MDEISFDNKTYTKVSVAAKKLGYTADYIGQLCRAKKVDARLVGRAWYVQVDSLLTHKNEKKSAVRSRNQSPKRSATKDSTASKHYVSRIRVEPLLTKSALRYSRTLSQESPSSNRYQSDDSALIPDLEPTTKAGNVPVGLAGAKSVRISANNTEVTTLTPTELPDVVLVGSLKVQSLPDEIKEETPENKDKKNIVSEPAKLSVKKRKLKTTSFTEKLHAVNVVKNDTYETIRSSGTLSKKLDSTAKTTKPDFQDNHQPAATTDASKNAFPKQKKAFAPNLPVIFAVLVSGLFFASVLLGVESVMMVTKDTGVASTLTFNPENLTQFFVH